MKLGAFSAFLLTSVFALSAHASFNLNCSADASRVFNTIFSKQKHVEHFKKFSFLVINVQWQLADAEVARRTSITGFANLDEIMDATITLDDRLYELELDEIKILETIAAGVSEEQKNALNAALAEIRKKRKEITSSPEYRSATIVTVSLERLKNALQRIRETVSSFGDGAEIRFAANGDTPYTEAQASLSKPVTAVLSQVVADLTFVWDSTNPMVIKVKLPSGALNPRCPTEYLKKEFYF